MKARRAALAGFLCITALLADAQPAKDAAEKKLEKERFALAKEVGRSVKEGLRDPDSLKFRQLGVSRDARVACFHFQAKNGFGGMNQKQLIVMDYKTVDATPANWKKHCQGLIDYLYVVQR